MNLKNHVVELRDDNTIIDGKPLVLPNIQFIKALKPGANGIVFEAYDKLLDRKVAVKVWLPRVNDSRDKYQQRLPNTQTKRAEKRKETHL
jgi:serine/threonine protein kinase